MNQFMQSVKNSRTESEIALSDIYALKAGSLWAAFKQQNISLWMLCLYYFFEYVRPQILYPELDILPWSQLTIILTLIAAYFDPSVKWYSSPLNKLLVIFYLIAIISSFAAFMPMTSWAERNVLLTWFLVYFLTINIVNTEIRLILFLLAYFLFNFKMSQHGALSWASRGFSFSSWGLVGAPGWFRNSGEFAIQMLIFGSLAIAFVCSLKDYWGRYKKWFFYMAAATGYMAVIGTSSRGSQLGLLAIGLWLLLKQEWGIKGILSLIVVAGILYAILPDQQLQRFNEMGADKSSLQRLAYWNYALTDLIPNHWLIGVGYHNWLEYVSFKVPQGMGPYMTVQEPHNIYILAAAEMGVIGLLSFLLLVIYGFIISARSRAMAKEMDKRFLLYLSYGLEAGLIGYLVAGSFVTVLYYPFFWIQLTMIVMVNHVAQQLYEHKKTDTKDSVFHIDHRISK